MGERHGEMGWTAICVFSFIVSIDLCTVDLASLFGRSIIVLWWLVVSLVG